VSNAFVIVAGYFYLFPSKANRHQQSHWPLRIGFDNVAALAARQVGACHVIEK